jgi:hypothetical protein
MEPTHHRPCSRLAAVRGSSPTLDVRSDARISHTSDMATIAVGDVHGNLLALTDLLGLLRAQITNEDTVVFLGDYIDRGPDTKG